MNAPALPLPDWTDTNQRLMSAEFARLKALLKGDGIDASSAQAARYRTLLEEPAAIDRLSERFGLTAFEREVLLLAAGVEMDGELAALCAGSAANRHPWATFGLAMAMLPEPHWSALAPVRPLRQWRLIEIGDEPALTTARLRIDERILHYLAGVSYLDRRLQPLMRRIPEPTGMADGQLSVARDIVTVLENEHPPLPVVQLCGRDAHGKRDISSWVAAHLGLRLYAIAAEDIPATAEELEMLRVLWERETALLDGALLIVCDDGPPPLSVQRFVERSGGLILLAQRDSLPLDRRDLHFQIEKPDCRDQLRLWRQVLGTQARNLDSALEGIATEFRLSGSDVWRIGSDFAHRQAASSDPETALWQACRGLEGKRIDGLAQRLEPAAGWDDLILPEQQQSILHQIATHLRHRPTVYQNWGFATKWGRGLGISALFAGESGTGKTLAAEVLANELHLDLYRIDLSAVVSKYIGETEKNLASVFDAAEDSGIILLFDEADALFGKRSEVKDSHDRYANIEVSYLLQRMESYRGLAILTSNQKAALDTAFLRRLRFVVNFPFPAAAERERIWRRIFPTATPINELDHSKLARLQMAGGNIRNIALNAAFHAAEEGLPVAMSHLLRAAQSEAAKRERPLSDAETRGWA